ncbi:MAG: DUF1573 domain-containing protein [Flavobacterium sp.]
MKYTPVFCIFFIFFNCNRKEDFPKVKFDSKNINIGDLKYGKTKSFNITLRNIGINDLIVKKIQPSCKCVVIESKDNLIISPNKTREFTFEYHGIEYGNSDESIVFYLNTEQEFYFVNVHTKVVK